MSDPYSVLEITPNATDEEVKKAYRELAKKYHPDNFKDNPLSELATEKMKSINEAYDTIQKARASGSYKYSGYTNNNAISDFPRIRELINSKRFSEAGIILDAVNATERNAEWHYLKGVLLCERSWYFDAQKYFEAACSLDPSNSKYRDAFYQIKNRANTHYSNGGYTAQKRDNLGCSGCDICTGLLCADCLCECFNCC